MTLWQDEYRVYFVLPIELLLMKLIYCILPISLDIEFLNKTDKLIVYYYSLLREFGIRKGLKKLVISSKIRIFIGENQ